MLRKLTLGALFAFILSLSVLGAGLRPASAAVVNNVRVAAVRANENVCEPGTSPIALSGTFHHVWYTTPDGTLKMNIQGHLTGTDADGTEYILISQQHMEHWSWPIMTPFTDRVRMNLISKGGTVNALVVMTFNVPAGGSIVPETSATACLG
jgi:hypothetical protein